MIDGSLKARVEFLLCIIELLFLSLTVEALQGKMCQNSLPSGGGRSLGAKISGGKCRPPACQYIDTTQKATDCDTTVPLTVLYNKTLQQTFRPVLSKLSKSRQI